MCIEAKWSSHGDIRIFHENGGSLFRVYSTVREIQLYCIAIMYVYRLVYIQLMKKNLTEYLLLYC